MTKEDRKMAASKKVYTIRETRSSLYGDRVREKLWMGTIEQLTEWFSYTLEVGESWQHERGNKRINRHPKTIESLCRNLENAQNNAARNGYSGYCYDVVEGGQQ
jgi:hypothetical protein